MKNSIGNLRLPASLGFVAILPFMLLAFVFDIANRLDTFGLRNVIDYIVTFGFLWFGLTAIISILLPIVRNIRAAKNDAANPAHAQESAVTSIIANPKSAALVGFILVLPFVAIFSLMMLHIDPPLGPLEPLLKNSDPDQPNIFGTLLVLGALLLAVRGGIIVRGPIVRTLRAGGSLLAHPMNMLLAVVVLSFIAIFVGGIIVDQYPCWLGVPNCD